MKPRLKQNEASLPRWAQERLEVLRGENRCLQDYVKTLREMSALTMNHDWTTLPGPSLSDNRDSYRLFILNRDQAQQVAVLFKEDKLFIGRARRRQP